MQNEIDAIKQSYDDDYLCSGLISLYDKTQNMLLDESRADVLDFACDILLFVEKIADMMQYDEEHVMDYTRMICERLSQTAGKKAKEVAELIEKISGLPPFPPSSLRSFIHEYRSMNAHIKHINES